MPGGSRKIGGRKWWAALAFAAVLLAVVLAVTGIPDLDAPHEGLCNQAEALKAARLLEKSAETYGSAQAEGHRCGEAGRREVEREQSEATESFTTAQAYSLAVAVSAPPKGKGKPKHTKSKAKKKKKKKKKTKRKKAATKAPAPALTAQRYAHLTVANYLAGLELDPFEEAARKGLAAGLKELQAPPTPAAATGRCELAERLSRAGFSEEAGLTVAESLSTAPKACRETLSQVGARTAEATKKLREATRLDAGGKTANARNYYAAALRADVGLTAARDGLEESIDDSSRLDAATSWLASVPPTLKGALIWLVPLAAFGLLLAVLAWAAVREVAARWPWLRRRLEGKGVPALIHNAATPELTFEDFDGGDDSVISGADFSKLLEVALPQKAGREPAFPFDRISKAAGADDAAFSELVGEVSESELLGQLFKYASRLFRRRVILVGGHLDPVADRGAGITLSLEGNGIRQSSTITLWEQDFDPLPGGAGAARWLRLVPAAAAWSRWQLAAAADAKTRKKLDDDPDCWRADALFGTAVAWQSMGDFIRAEALYASALERDPELLPASHNLAVIEIRNGRYKQAGERIEMLQATLQDEPERAKPWPTLPTAALYTLALALAYPEVPRVPGKGDLKRALKTCRKLIKALSRQLAVESDVALAAELVRAESPSVVLLASLMIRHDPGLRAEAVEVAIADERGAEIKRSRLTGNLSALKPWELIDGYVRNQPDVTRRSHYNLACYYVTLTGYAGGATKKGDCLNLALSSLDSALVGGELVAWAKQDPSLAALRKARRARFNKIVKAHTVEAHPATDSGG